MARWVPRVQLASLAVLALCVYLVGRGTTNSPLAAEVGRRPWLLALGYSGSLATLMVAISLGPKTVQWPFANPLVRWLGDISYGVYLVHMVVITFVLRWLGLAADTEAGGLVGESPLVSGDGKLDTMFIGGSDRAHHLGAVRLPVRAFPRAADPPLGQAVRAPLNPSGAGTAARQGSS